MDPSFLIAQIERMQLQISLESDPATQRVMRKTLNHLHRQYRSATRHTQPWHGLKSVLVFLLILFGAFVYAILLLSKSYGWSLTLVVSILCAVILLLFISVFLLLKGVISPQTFETLVDQCFKAFRWIRGGDRTLRIPVMSIKDTA